MLAQTKIKMRKKDRNFDFSIKTIHDNLCNREEKDRKNKDYKISVTCKWNNDTRKPLQILDKQWGAELFLQAINNVTTGMSDPPDIIQIVLYTELDAAKPKRTITTLVYMENVPEQPKEEAEPKEKYQALKGIGLNPNEQTGNKDMDLLNAQVDFKMQLTAKDQTIKDLEREKKELEADIKYLEEDIKALNEKVAALEVDKEKHSLQRSIAGLLNESIRPLASQILPGALNGIMSKMQPQMPQMPENDVQMGDLEESN